MAVYRPMKQPGMNGWAIWLDGDVKNFVEACYITTTIPDMSYNKGKGIFKVRNHKLSRKPFLCK